MSSIALSPRRHVRALPRPATMLADAGYLLAGLPLGILAFTVAVTGLGLALGLAITLLGIPVLLGTLYACRWLGALERARASALLGTPVRGRERDWSGSLWRRTVGAATDPAAWRDVLWSLLLLPLGTAGFAVAVSFWSTALGLLTSPLYYWALSSDDDTIPLLDSTSLEWSALRVLIGVVLVPVAAWTCRGVASGTARAARSVLGRKPLAIR
jgi:hypothetical protein